MWGKRRQVGSENDTDAPSGIRRRATRTLGPFSGTQLTIILCTIVATVGFPFAASALTSGTNVFLTDPSGSGVAHVNANGSLNTAVIGAVSAKVSGSVIADPAVPPQMYTNSVDMASGGCHAVALPPSGKALIVTGVHDDLFSFSSLGGGTPPVNFTLWRGSANQSAANCGNGVIKDVTTLNEFGSFETTFSSGLPVANGKALYVYVSLSGGANVQVSVSGYLVPASDCIGSNICS